jgi:glyoxylase-like metal-dependent hydrolase (beta-lactamase superfamily II)
MNDNNEGTGYLVVGNEKAVVIDTMNGYEDVNEIVKKITDLPIMVINTHGHPDHILGNVYFQEAYIHPRDMELGLRFFKDPEVLKYMQERDLQPAVFKPIQEGTIVNLGEISLEVFEIPGHSPGGICLLLREDRILFTGDSINEHTWMQLPESLPMEEFYHNLERLSKIRDCFDYILAGHSRKLEDASLYEIQKQGVKEVMEGSIENDYDYEWFGGVDRAHPYGKSSRVIVYKIKKE